MHDSELKQLALTKRFLKSDRLRSVEKIEKYVYPWTLDFKDVDLESEWRLQEIKGKRIFFIITIFFCVFQDVVWTMIL